MKIYVCVKHVPDTAANIKIVGDTAFDESVKFVMNPFDEYALEEAVRTAEARGGEVVVLSVGKEAAIKTIRAALALGAHRGILVKSESHFLDSATTAAALSKAIEKDGPADLIFAGKQSVDSEGMQTHYRLAAALGIPILNNVVRFQLEGAKVTAEHELGAGQREVVELALPCLIGATRGLNEPRFAKLPDVMKAKKKPVLEMDLAELGLDSHTARESILELAPVPERGAATMLQGSVKEMVAELILRLKEEARVL